MKPSAPFLLCCLGAVIVVLVFAIIGQARGHSWYPQECCSGVDCKPVEASEVGERGDLYTYQGLTIRKDQSRPSQDERYHVCVTNGGFGARLLRCLFRPTPGS